MQQMMDLEPLVKFREAMNYLRVSRSTLLRWMDDGKVPAHKIGATWRFYREDLRQFVNGKKTAEQGEE